LLVDAGLSPTQVEQRLAVHGISPDSLHGILISHNHSDHVRYAASCSAKFGVPLFVTRPTLTASKSAVSPRECREVEFFRAGDSLKLGALRVETVGTPHDAVDGVVFVIDDGVHRLGICTDLGHVFADLRSLVAGVDGLFLENNFDEQMLENGRYPQFLKRRIRGPGGHISNREAAELVARHASSRLQWLCLAHLSDKNNTAAKALQANREALGSALPIHVTSRHRAIEKLQLGGGQMCFDF
jgi:phosphoribosyl 1,2-cyclic phosphodiesterase